MGKNRRSHKSNILVLLLLTVLAGCMDKRTKIKAFFPYLSSDNLVDPAKLDMIHRYYVVDNICGKLVYVNHENDYEYILAKNIEKKNELEYILTLKDSVSFSNGDQITARDVLDSFKRMILLGSSHVPMAEIILDADKLTNNYNDIDGLYQINDKKIGIKLSREVNDFLYYLSLADTCILHSSIVRKTKIEKKDWKVVSGAYFVEGDTLKVNKKFVGYDELMPEEVSLINSPQNGSVDDLKGYDIGVTAFIDKSNGNFLNPPEGIRYTTDSYSFLTYLVLNPDSKLFSSPDKRRAVYSLINNNFKTPESNNLFKKANQYFLPEVAGVNPNYSVSNVFSKFKLDQKLDDFTILTTRGTKKYTFEDLDKEISKSLNNNTKIDFIDEADQYYERTRSRDFDAYLLPVSMNYNVPLEALNHLFAPSDNFVKPTSNKLKILVQELQGKQLTPGVLDEILNEMAIDAVVVPLFYVSSPKFYNYNTVDASLMNKTESIAFWRLRVK
jgi:ABC-type transport system substrate-binding protein